MISDNFDQELKFYTDGMNNSSFDCASFVKFAWKHVGEKCYAVPVKHYGDVSKYDKIFAATMQIWERRKEHGYRSDYPEKHAVQAFQILGNIVETLPEAERVRRYKDMLDLAVSMKKNNVFLNQNFLPLWSLRTMPANAHYLFADSMRAVGRAYIAPDDIYTSVSFVMSVADGKLSDGGMTELFDVGYSIVTRERFKEPEWTLKGIKAVAQHIGRISTKGRMQRFKTLANDAALLYEAGNHEPRFSGWNNDKFNSWHVCVRAPALLRTLLEEAIGFEQQHKRAAFDAVSQANSVMNKNYDGLSEKPLKHFEEKLGLSPALTAVRRVIGTAVAALPIAPR
jgi:hypothetical protein